MASDPMSAIARWLAAVIVGSAVEAAVDASEEALPRFGRRHPRVLLFARLVGGAFLVLTGVWEAVLSMVVFADVAITGDFKDRVATLVLLLPLSMGVGLTVWGLRMMRRGWASRRRTRVAAAQIRTCPQCGTHMHPEARICSQCGSDSPRWTLYEGVWWTQSAAGEWQWLDEDAGLFRSGSSPSDG